MTFHFADSLEKPYARRKVHCDWLRPTFTSVADFSRSRYLDRTGQSFLLEASKAVLDDRLVIDAVADEVVAVKPQFAFMNNGVKTVGER